MKISILILIFTFSFSAFSAEFYLYYSGKKHEVINSLTEADPNIIHQEIYTETEKEFLKTSGIHVDILKINTILDKTYILSRFPDFKVEPVQVFKLNSNDYSDLQWHLFNPGGIITRRISDIETIDINAIAGEDINALNIQETNKEIKVAIIDSGVDTTHPDLAAQILTKPLECQSLAAYKECLSTRTDKLSCHEEFANIDNDNNGYPLDCHGWSMTNSSYPGVKITGNPEMKDFIGHGTHVAGIIAAKKNSEGIDGIINQVKILPIQVAMNSGSANPIENIAKGVLYAIKNNVQVINLSLGWRTKFDSQLMRDMIKLATKENILVVVAGGNNSHSDISYPCAYDDVICTAAHDQTGQLASYSNNGTQIDLIAPGHKILSTWPTTKRSKYFTQDYNYEFMSGTSQAAPVVAGALAKLLNLGFSAQESRIKLLAGSRDKVQKSQIRHGNIDIKKAIRHNANSFIYPLNKTPFLVKWTDGQKHKFKLRVKNYGKDIQAGKFIVKALNKNQTVITPTITHNTIKTNETFEIDIPFTDSHKQESEMLFSLKIQNADETKEYTIKVQYIRLISDQSNESDISHITINNKLEKDTIIRPFDNITNFDSVDYFVSNVKRKKTNVSVLKTTKDGLVRSRQIPLQEKNPVFLNFSKVDIDGDQKEDYVIMYVYINKEKNKITRFMIFDHDLNPKRYFLSPKNEFPNDKTFIPGKFKWIKLAKKMVPGWIGYGETATVNNDPWNPQEVSEGNFFYYLTADGLKNFVFDDNEILLHTIYQSQEQMKAGVVDFLTSKDVGFFKTYLHYTYNDGVKLNSKVKLNNFFDIFENKPLPLVPGGASAFFQEESINGSQNILGLRVNNGRISDEFIKLSNTTKNESIKFVHLITDDNIVYQTNHKIINFNRANNATSTRESKVDTKRRKYKVLLNTKSLYLPASEAPGMTSELLQVNSTGSLVSNGQFRTLAVNNCEEFGIVQNDAKDYIGYICRDAQKILLLNIQ